MTRTATNRWIHTGPPNPVPQDISLSANVVDAGNVVRDFGDGFVGGSIVALKKGETVCEGSIGLTNHLLRSHSGLLTCLTLQATISA